MRNDLRTIVSNHGSNSTPVGCDEIIVLRLRFLRGSIKLRQLAESDASNNNVDPESPGSPKFSKETAEVALIKNDVCSLIMDMKTRKL